MIVAKGAQADPLPSWIVDHTEFAAKSEFVGTWKLPDVESVK